MRVVIKALRENPLLALLVFVPTVFVAQSVAVRIAHAAVRAVRPGHRAVGDAAQSRHGISGGQDWRHRRRASQCHAWQPDRARHRAGGTARRPVHAGQGLDRRRHRDQHVVHDGRVASPRRAQASCPGVQPEQRAAAGQPAVPRHDRVAGAVDHHGRRFRPGGGVSASS